MAVLKLAVQSTPPTPGAGVVVMSFDTTTKRLKTRDETGFVRTLGFTNFSTAAQPVVAATRTYVVGTNTAVTGGALQAGTMYRWKISMTKTAAGTAASTFDICFGTLGTTGDTARVSFTKPAGTAIADEAMVVITAIVRGPVGASGVVVGTLEMTHNLAATGHAVIPCVNVVTVSAAFDITTPTNIGVCLTTGALDAITIQLVTAEAWNL